VTFALVIYKYFPYGGLQRDMLRIALELLGRGHKVRVYCMSWQGERPAALEVWSFPGSALASAVTNNTRFYHRVMAALEQQPVDAVVGFNKMPGLDVYFAGDGCFAEAALSRPGAFYRRSRRYRHFSACEHAVFHVTSPTRVLLLTDVQREAFQRHYDTPGERMVILPPGVDAARHAPDDSAALRRTMRGELGLEEGELVLLFVGAAFDTKGLDRAIESLAALQREQSSVKARLLVAGPGKVKPFAVMAKRLGVAGQVDFLGGREDVLELMLAADVLVHPARAEAGGVVLLEAIAAGLPVVTTHLCGYASQVKQARAGLVLPEPFLQQQLDRAVMRCIDGVFRADCRESALRYARMTDLHRMPAAAADQLERWTG